MVSGTLGIKCVKTKFYDFLFYKLDTMLKTEGVLHQMFSKEVQHAMKNGPNLILGFVNMRGQKDL